uniref:rRNA adenine N(6)-methyltransferase n=1 Tax=Strongyloides venezuelensis TaxID=75913 RepID=A0A0K0G0M2_STRVS
MSRLPPLPSLKNFIHMYRLRAKKILSQNFLMDMNLTRKIVRKVGNVDNAHVIEIGPGPGSITRALLERNIKSLDVIEIDSRFIPPLEHLAEASENRLKVHRDDALKVNFENIWKDYVSEANPWIEDCKNFYVVGNLPFNIASPLIIKFLRDMSNITGAMKYGRVPLILCFQKEVGKRICSPVDCDSRSRISIVSQYISQPEYLFEIPGSCFVPPPEVDVAVIKLTPRIEPLIPCSFDLVEKVARHIFHYRRKHIIKCIKTLYPKDLANDLAKDLLKKSSIDQESLSFQLGISEFSRICEEYEKQCLNIPGLFQYDYRNNDKPLSELEKLEKNTPPLLVKNFNVFHEGVSLKNSKDIIM